MYVPLNQLGNLVQDQSVNVHTSQSALQRACTMCNDFHHLLDECLIGRDLPIPAVDEILDNDSYDGVKLYVDLIATGQWWQQLIDWPLLL